jgi:hypothetical protein
MSLQRNLARFLLRTTAACSAATAVLAAPVFTNDAHATTVLKVSIPEMVQMSEWVLRVRITAIEHVDARAAKARPTDGIFTDVAFEVLDVYAAPGGPAGQSPPRSMRLLGGIGRDGIALTVPGMPKFVVGDETVIFLEKSRDGHIPCGLQQGVWNVIRGATGLPIVRQSTEGLLMVSPATGGEVAPAHDHGKERHLLLSQLVAAIRAVGTR